MKNLAFILIITFLASCVSPEDKKKALDAQEKAQCLDLGFRENTEAFANCRLQIRELATQEAAGRVAKYNAIMGNMNANKVRTCSPNGVGGMTCY